MFRVMYALIAKRDVRLDPTLVPPEQALEMATVNGARAALWDDEIGSLEEGKKADLILLDSRRHDWVPVHNPISNLVHATCGDAVQDVVIDGRLVMKDRKILTRFAAPRWPVI